MEISNEFGGKQITSKQAQQIINELSPELKAVADKYLEKENSPEIALELAKAQQIINELSPELKAVADEYLEKGNSPKIALELAYKASAIIDKQKIEELKKGL